MSDTPYYCSWHGETPQPCSCRDAPTRPEGLDRSSANPLNIGAAQMAGKVARSTAKDERHRAWCGAGLGGEPWRCTCGLDDLNEQVAYAGHLQSQARAALDALRAEYAEIVSAVRVTHRYISERGIKPTDVHHANCEIGNWLASLPLPPEPSR